MANPEIIQDPLRAFFRSLPKAELHLHLEGVIPDPSFDELEEKYQTTIPRPKDTGFAYDGIRDFISAWRIRTSLLREYEDFTFAAEAVGKELKASGITYAELHISPGSRMTEYGLDPQELLFTIWKGFAKTTGINLKLIVDLVRDQGVEKSAYLLDQAIEVAADARIVAIGLGGTEGDFPVEGYRELFLKARRHGLHTVAHAGESAGPESIWSAIQTLEVERIGHGTTCVQDQNLLTYLEEKQLPLEVCVTSNVRLGAVSGIKHHPLPHLLRSGLKLTLSSDDPALFGTTIVDECLALHTELGLSLEEITGLLRNGFACAFLSEKEKTEALKNFDQVLRTK